jgi:hypothetical protein
MIRGCLISVILAGVPLTSRKLHTSRRQSSAAASYPLFWWVLASRHGYYVLPGGGAIRHSVISLILVPVLCPTGNHVLADNTCAFQIQVCCTFGNAYNMLGRERDPCVYNSEPPQAGRKRQRNCNYTNPHFRTDQNQTLHKSPPSSGRDRGACMGPQHFTFPTFST